MKKPSAFIFDAYGTIVHSALRINPYKKAIDECSFDKSPVSFGSPMILNGNFAEFLGRIGYSIPDAKYFLDLMDTVIESTYPCPHATSVLTMLRDKGYPIIVASNLAHPYAKPLEKHYGHLVDYFAYSFKIGFVKPDPQFYKHMVLVANRLDKCNLTPDNQALMIGDSYHNDFEGPRSHPSLTSFWAGDGNHKVDWFKVERFIKENDL